MRLIMTTTEIVVWLMIGAAAGGISSLIMPNRTAGGMVSAMLVGVLGGVLGGWLVSWLLNPGLAGLVGAVIAATAAAMATLLFLEATRDL
jgi:uncharacterized membrane protein YeaQ/YmgE (transglycosylase-associated protein family)